MKESSRQLTLDAATSDATELEHYDWTFARANTRYLTHGLHKYPAKMPPQIPSTLLDVYESRGVIEPGSTVYDPFSGSGTTAVEARLAGHDAIANDVNPFACLLTAGKAIPLRIDALERAERALFDGLRDAFDRVADAHSRNALERELADDPLADAEAIGTEWFPEPQLYQLLATRQRLDELAADGFDSDAVRFLRLCLARAARRISYQRTGEFKRYRMSPEDRRTHDPSVHAELREAVDDNVSRMRAYSRRVDHDLETTVFGADSRHVVESAEHPIGENEADIVVTSPPYGDHETTVAYGEFSTNIAVIADGRGVDEMLAVDDRGLGGPDSSSVSIERLEEWSPSLHEVVGRLEEIDGRSQDAVEFFEDFVQVIDEVGTATKPGRPVAWVVACRRMSGELIPIHEITRELCEHLGYTFEAALPRHIKDKTLPSKNRQGKTMAEEHIIVMRAPE